MLETKMISKTTAPPITRKPPITLDNKLTVQDLAKLKFPITIKDNLVLIEKGLIGFKLRTPVAVNINKVLAVQDLGLIEYILKSLSNLSPDLIPFTLDNKTVIRLADHYLNACSGSEDTCKSSIYQIFRYSNWLGHTPDDIIADLKTENDQIDNQRLKNHNEFLERYVSQLKYEGLGLGTYTVYCKRVRAFYVVNGVPVVLPDMKKNVRVASKNKDRAPKPDELVALLDLADVRGKLVLALAALCGLREATIANLRYRHVMVDLEAGIVPIHIHIDVNMTKGQYGDYDTFIGPEGIIYLKLYLGARRKGTRYMKPEVITPESPLIRDIGNNKVKGITPAAIGNIVRALYKQANLQKKTLGGRRYELREHSIRKYFKTQMTARHVDEEFIEYMMGHIRSTYLDVQSLGPEFLRNIYRAANLTIRQSTKIGKLDAIKEVIKAYGLNPEELLVKDAQVNGNITRIDGDVTEHQLSILGQELKRLIVNEVKGESKYKC